MKQKQLYLVTQTQIKILQIIIVQVIYSVFHQKKKPQKQTYLVIQQTQIQTQIIMQKLQLIYLVNLQMQIIQIIIKL